MDGSEAVKGLKDSAGGSRLGDSAAKDKTDSMDPPITSPSAQANSASLSFTVFRSQNLLSCSSESLSVALSMSFRPPSTAFP